MTLGLLTSDLLILWRDSVLALTWLVICIYLFSGLQDLVYDIVNYTWRIVRRFRYARRPRLTLARLRLCHQQYIAVFVPAWKEADVVDKMVENILRRVEYRHYVIFVGTYPNDPDTQRAVDALAATYPEVVKVVTSRPGPTNKADCLNHLYQAVKAYEQSHDVYFEVIVMHDAEDFVHPYSFLLYNYLIPRVDAVQLPILPFSVPLRHMIHWVYADEFAENHMKDVLVRERMGGFVPFAGVGTGFSRRLFRYLERESRGQVFNESSLTEDYSLAKKVRAAGMESIFVNLVLGDDNSPWYTPLCRRPGFIANWSYFPFDFTRSVRQKTRWITGIALQEWEQSGWIGSLAMKENLLKDRKGFVASAACLLGYFILLYMVIYLLGEHGILPFKWEPLIREGTLLGFLLYIVAGFMIIRFIQRFTFVALVYGLLPAMLTGPRLLVGNVVNGLASFRALNFYLASWAKPKLRWDKTDHQEGVGEHVVAAISETARSKDAVTTTDFLRMFENGEVEAVLASLDRLHQRFSLKESKELTRIVQQLSRSQDCHVRAMTARVIGQFYTDILRNCAQRLLFDSEWVVRANAARALMKSPCLAETIGEIVSYPDRYAWEIMIKTLEQNETVMSGLFYQLTDNSMAGIRTAILGKSRSLNKCYHEWLESCDIAWISLVEEEIAAEEEFDTVDASA